MLGTVATDGSCLYVHSSTHGLMKVGTGAGGTVRGALCGQNAAYRTGDSRRSLAYAAGKLLYTSPELSQPRAEPRQAKVAVVNAETLQVRDALQWRHFIIIIILSNAVVGGGSFCSPFCCRS